MSAGQFVQLVYEAQRLWFYAYLRFSVEVCDFYAVIINPIFMLYCFTHNARHFHDIC